MNLQKKVDDILAAIDKAKAKLEALDKVELKAGDCGVYKSCDGWTAPAIIDSEGTARLLVETRGCTYASLPTSSGASFTKSGNYLDDLKRNSKDLREFTMQDAADDDILVEIGDGVIVFDFEEEMNTFGIDEVTQFHQKLGQMLATLRRDEEKK